LDNVDTALDMAQDLYGTFLEQKQGKNHQTPKTLAIIDTTKFMDFLVAWEALAAELSRLLDTNDPYLLPILNRARQVAISFQGYSDEGKQQTAVDIGSFLATFDALCQPVAGVPLQSLRSTAADKYMAMQVATGVGPGTQAATGVQLFWPTRRDYALDKTFYTKVLFNDPTSATQDAPNWLVFLQKFYSASEPTSSSTSGDSVCVANPSSITQPTREGQVRF
jgi:hypothetical protein